MISERLQAPVEMSDNKLETDLSYLVIRPHQMAEVHRLMYESFHLDEPMTNHLKLCQVSSLCLLLVLNLSRLEGPNSIPDSDAMADSLVTDHNLSIMAVDRQTNSPVAVMLNGVFNRSEIDAPPSEVPGLSSYKCSP